MGAFGHQESGRLAVLRQEQRSEKPHLLFLVSEDWYFVSHRLSLAQAGLEAGYRVTVATRVSSHGEEIRNAGIELVELPFRRAGLNPLREAAFFLRLLIVYRHLRPDVVHHVAMKPVVMGSLAAKLARVPAVVNALGGLGYVFTSSSARAKLLRPLVGGMLKLALGGSRQALILQNGDDRALLVNGGFVDASSVRLVRGVGVDPAQFSMEEPVNPACLVVLPARMLRDKGVCEFVTAARQLRDEGLSVRFALVGEPDAENPASLTEREIEAWVEEGVVEYWGWRSDMPAVMAQANVVCLPSYREGLPKALLEAAAAARAIVTTDTPGCREVVRHEFNGLLVPPRDAEALASAIRALVLDADKRKLFGLNGRRRVETEFSLSGALAATLAIYRELHRS